MKIRIAKTVLKQKSPELNNLFGNLLIQSKEDLGEIVEYTTPGEGSIDVHYLDGVFLMGAKEGFNLATPGALLPGKEIKLTEDEKKPKPEKKGNLEINVCKTEEDVAEVKIKPKGRPSKIYTVTKENKIMDLAGNFLSVGTEFKKAEIQKQRQLKNMINWNWCIEQS